MTQVTISRDTLFWRDQIVTKREELSVVDAQLQPLLLLPLSHVDRNLLKYSKSEFRRIDKELEVAIVCFACACLDDLKAIV